MKLLSIVVPCYNSASYMHRCIESLLCEAYPVEIIIVDDGSSDDTAKIATRYLKQYPETVRVVQKVNGGHGSAVNAGLAKATGVFFKVVDSDDWVEQGAYQGILHRLSSFEPKDQPDLFLSNFVYEKEGKKCKKVMRYANVLPKDTLFGWEEMRHFKKGQYLLMHAMIYKTEVLRACRLQLPHHTFYVDNLYAYLPLEYVQKLYYSDVDFYRYYIGREGQSVQEATMIKRIDQQLRVNYMMLSAIAIDTIENDRQRAYLFHYLEIITTISSILLVRGGTARHLAKKKELWQWIGDYNPKLYRKLRWGFLGQVVNLPGPAGRRISVSLYKLSQRFVGFN